MAQAQHTPTLASLEEAITVLFCLIDDAYRLLNPKCRRYESLKRLSDSEVLTLVLFQQLRGTERANDPFCVRPNGSSSTSSPESRGCTLPLCIAG